MVASRGWSEGLDVCFFKWQIGPASIGSFGSSLGYSRDLVWCRGELQTGNCDTIPEAVGTVKGH
jgi:hypothetical protein